MTPKEREEWQDYMRQLMQLSSDLADLSKKISDLYIKIDNKLDEKGDS